MDKKLIQDLKNQWRNCNSATVGFLTSIPADKLQTKPFEPRFTTFAWEFACLIRTRYCYLEGLKTGKLTFYHSKAEFKLPESFVKTWGESNF